MCEISNESERKRRKTPGLGRHRASVENLYGEYFCVLIFAKRKYTLFFSLS